MDRIVISISGKGGTGKTTLAALLLKILTESNDRDILVVDADPASNVPDTIGISVEKTVGTMATKLKKRVQADELPPASGNTEERYPRVMGYGNSPRDS